MTNDKYDRRRNEWKWAMQHILIFFSEVKIKILHFILDKHYTLVHTFNAQILDMKVFFSKSKPFFSLLGKTILYTKNVNFDFVKKAGLQLLKIEFPATEMKYQLPPHLNL